MAQLGSKLLPLQRVSPRSNVAAMGFCYPRYELLLQSYAQHVLPSRLLQQCKLAVRVPRC